MSPVPETPKGVIGQLMDLLVGLERTIDPDLRVSRWQPLNVEPPHLYNWITPSNASVVGTETVADQLQLAIIIVVPNDDPEDQVNELEYWWDKARDVIDADLVRPAESVLVPVTRFATRTRMRNVLPVFNDIQYLGLELTLQLELRRRFA